jgi:hypothetical protein
MPNILQSLIPLFGGKTVLVSDQAGNEVFPAARFLKVEIKPESRPMEHPVESGATITDHRILLPIEIELSTVLSSLDYKDVYKQIVGFYTNATLLTVQCRAGTFTNQLIQAIPHTEDADQYDAIILSLKMKQVLIATTPTVSNSTPLKPAGGTVTAPLSPNNSPSQARGQIGDRAPTGAQTVDGQAKLAEWGIVKH